MPHRTALAYAAAVFLFLAGVLLQWRRATAAAAAAITTYYLLFVILLTLTSIEDLI